MLTNTISVKASDHVIFYKEDVSPALGLRGGMRVAAAEHGYQCSFHDCGSRLSDDIFIVIISTLLI